jgi:phosphatidylglycerophosphatase C
VTETRDRHRTVAAFDFDGTLTRRDSLVPFLARVCGWPRVLMALAVVAPRYALVLAGRGDRDRTKEHLLTRCLRGRSHDRVVAMGAAYGADLARDRIEQSVRRRVLWHRAQGHDVFIVSASLDVYLDTVGRMLDAKTVLCTRLEVDERGLCTGRMLDGNCRGAGKAERLREHLGDGPTELWAYGDSEGDREMFAMADHVVRLRRGRLREDG